MKYRDEILDLIRGLSALMVLFAHVRGFILVDHNDVANSGTLANAFYLGTGFHHQAVMVFFVLSGYFVGGSVIEAFREGRFSPAHYALARLSRLWMALIPALLLTLLLDSLGRTSNPEAYAGGFREIFMSGPEPGGNERYSLLTFLGNLAFLQTVELPAFGSNGPLWSLSNEFWYYVLFPMAVYAAVPSYSNARWWILLSKRFAAALLFFALISWLPSEMVFKGLIWLFGVLVWCFGRITEFSIVVGGWRWKIVGAAAFLATLAASKTTSVFGSDFAVGLAFALWMPSLIGPWKKPGWWQRWGSGLSAVSYTLYVVHFPVLFLITTTLLNGDQFQPDAQGLIWFMGLSIICFGIAVVMWWCFESRTEKARRLLSRVLRLPSLKTA